MARVTYKIQSSSRRRRRQRLLRVSVACVMGLSVVAFLALKAPKNPVDHHASSANPARVAAAQSSPPTAVNHGLPTRLKIPKLAIDAPITYMGLTKTGDMAVPDNITDVGWYKNGSLPGNKGSAVLAGHLDGIGGEPGVFASLDKLQKGDTLQVIDSNGKAISFTVRATRTYSKDAQPSEVFSAADAAHLNLITCTGAWDNVQRHFLERLVVFTDKSG